MSEVFVYSFLSVSLVSILSLVGIFIFLYEKEMRKEILLYLVSFSVGGLFGGALFHLIPEATEASGFSTQVSIYVLSGIICSFLIEQGLRWRHCHVLTSDEHPHSFGYMNLFGDSVHNFIDGIAIGASYLVSASMGVATTIAICLHELPQEMGDFGILLYAGFERRKALLYNFFSALTAFLGVGITLFLNLYVKNLTDFLIPFAAGNFIYIAGSDLIPELHAEEKIVRTIIQLSMMLFGIILLYSIKLIT